jgi:hypothetical protein
MFIQMDSAKTRWTPWTRGHWGAAMADRFDNRLNTHRPDKDPPTVRKVSCDAVPFGDSISTNGTTVWVAYDATGTLIAVASTSAEVRRRYRERRRARMQNVAEDS